MRVLVTGGAGFLGGYIVATLAAAGHEVFAYDRATPSPEMLAVAPQLSQRLFLGEINDLARLIEVCRAERIEAIVHGAARLGFRPSLADPVGYYQTNIMGTVNACEAARFLGIRKLVVVSSNAAYHPGRGEKLVETDAPFSVTRANPAAHYGTSKMAGEAIGMAYAEFHGLDFLALRVTALYGFGMREPIHLKPMVENSVLGRPTRIETGGPMKRDFTHIRDVSRAFLRAIELPEQPAGSQRVLNVSAGEVHTSSRVADIVRCIIPGADIEIGATLTPTEESNARMRAPLDVAKSGELLGWSPEWRLDDGIAEYVERFSAYARETDSSSA